MSEATVSEATESEATVSEATAGDLHACAPGWRAVWGYAWLSTVNTAPS